MQNCQKKWLGWILTGGLSCGSALAGTNEIDFNNPPGDLYVEVGATSAEHRSDGGASGAAGDGYLSVTDARPGQRSTLVFKDLDDGLVVKAFTFECDLRMGGGHSNPADGFSLNYVRADDPLVTDGGPYAGTEGEANLPEEGSLTGLGIGFDTWQSGNHPGGITDVVGISVRIDGQLVTQFPVPLRPGNQFPGGVYDPVPYRNLATNDVNYLQSMQTGARSDLDLNGDGEVNDADGSTPQPDFGDPTWGDWVRNLKWERFKVELTEDSKIKIFWKGVELTPEGGLQTTFAPSPGRIVFGARTGDNFQVHHVDNIRLVTIAADTLIVGPATGNPIGFSITTLDSGPAVADPSTVQVKLNGETLASPSISKEGITTTIVYGDVTKPFTIGSTNTVELTVTDTRGISVTQTREFVTASYVTLPPAYAVTGVNTADGGFNVRVHQTATRSQETTVARAEQQLNGLRGANVADLSSFTGGVFTEPTVINYSQPDASGFPEPAGFFQENFDNPDLNFPDVLIPGIPSLTESGDDGGYYTDNIAAEVTAYLHFPEPGAYSIIFNSDDGFRTTVAPNFNEVLDSVIVSQADVGKGASDVVATVYVPEAGYYPFRTVWFEGGGGASLEWSALRVAPNPTARYLINDAPAAAINAYRTRTGDIPAAVSFLHPFRDSGNPFLGTVPVIVAVQDGSTAVDDASIRLLLNGAEVTATKNKTGNTTTVTYDPPGNLPGGDHQVIVRFTAGGQNYDLTNSFTIRSAVAIAPSLALPAGAVNTANRGFLVKTVQQDNGAGMETTTYRGLTQIAGFFGWPNTADLSAFTGPDGYYVEPNVINYTATGEDGYFDANRGYPDAPAPGIPGAAEADGGTDNYTHEILTVLDLQPGIYVMNVNSDDGFITTVGNPAEAFTLPTVVGEFNAGRGAGDAFGSGTTFYFEVLQAGLYPFRTITYEGGGGSGIEWSVFSYDPATGATTGGQLINSGEPGAVVAYQYPVTSAGAPYVKSFLPPRSGWASTLTPSRSGTDAVVKVVVAEGVGSVDPAAVTLQIDDVPVTPTVNKANGEVTITYAPAGGWAANSTHTAELTYGDRTVNWSFQIGSIRTPTFFVEAEDFDNNGVAQAAASAMPYFGGAYAGLGATATDYQRPAQADWPVYRMGEDPNVPLVLSPDRDRGVSELAVNFRIGWVDANQWYQYTRDFPAGQYHVYAGLSHGDAADSATRIGGNLATVTGGTPTIVGSFFAPATGGWGNSDLVPLRDTATTNALVTVELAGQQTIRFTTLNGDYDFLLFVPASEAGGLQFDSVKLNPDGTITIEWTGTATLEAAPTLNGPWTAVAGATSPYTFTPSDDQLFGRLVE